MTTTTIQSLGRFQIIEGTPPCAPGKCVVCGITEGPFVDFGFELNFYNVVYFCLINCVRELYNLLKFISPLQ